MVKLLKNQTKSKTQFSFLFSQPFKMTQRSTGWTVATNWNKNRTYIISYYSGSIISWWLVTIHRKNSKFTTRTPQTYMYKNTACKHWFLIDSYCMHCNERWRWRCELIRGKIKPVLRSFSAASCCPIHTWSHFDYLFLAFSRTTIAWTARKKMEAAKDKKGDPSSLKFGKNLFTHSTPRYFVTICFF